MKVSICVPVYTMKNNLGEIFLVEFLSHLLYQTYKNFEVIISDQSVGSNLKHICESFKYVLNLTYVNDSTINCAAKNVNNTFKYVSGDIVKLLYCDDFFIDNTALEKIVNSFKIHKESKWLLTGFTHCNMDKTDFYDTRIPWYGNTVVNGDNTTGNPSSYSVRRECLLPMDENLLFIVDGEYFYQSYYYFGNPIIIQDTLVAFREHEASAFRDPELIKLLETEKEYCIEKYKKLSSNINR